MSRSKIRDMRAFYFLCVSATEVWSVLAAIDPPQCYKYFSCSRREPEEKSKLLYRFQLLDYRKNKQWKV